MEYVFSHVSCRLRSGAIASLGRLSPSIVGRTSHISWEEQERWDNAGFSAWIAIETGSLNSSTRAMACFQAVIQTGIAQHVAAAATTRLVSIEGTEGPATQRRSRPMGRLPALLLHVPGAGTHNAPASKSGMLVSHPRAEKVDRRNSAAAGCLRER